MKCLKNLPKDCEILRNQVPQRITRHFTPTQTVLYDFMTQRDGTMQRLHQILLQISRESGLRRRLTALKLMEILQKKCSKIVSYFVPRIAKFLGKNHPKDCAILRVMEAIDNEVYNLIIIYKVVQLGTRFRSSGLKPHYLLIMLLN